MLFQAQQENDIAAELRALVSQHHRGLTTVLLRRKGRQPFAAATLQNKDGASVGHKEAPAMSVDDIAKQAWDACQTHALDNGGGTYEIELRFAQGERGTPPKPQTCSFACGADVVDVGTGTDPTVLIGVALRLADFSCRHLATFLGVLPAIGQGTADNLTQLHGIGSTMLRTMQTATSSSETVEMARLKAQAERDRTALAREVLAPGVELLRVQMGLQPRAATPAIAAAATPADGAVTSSSSTGVPTPSIEQGIAAELLSVGRQLGSSLTDGQLAGIGRLCGLTVEAAARGLAKAETHVAIIDATVTIIEVPEDDLFKAMATLTNEQQALVQKCTALASQYKAAADAAAAASAVRSESVEVAT